MCIRDRQNTECRTIFSSDPSTVLGAGFWPLVAFLSQTTNNSCAHYILSLSARNFFDLPLPPFLPAQAQHRPLIPQGLIDMVRFYPSSTRPKKLCTLLLNLNLPGRTFYKVPRILPAGRPKPTIFIYTKLAALPSREILMNFLYFTILSAREYSKTWQLLFWV